MKRLPSASQRYAPSPRSTKELPTDGAKSSDGRVDSAGKELFRAFAKRIGPVRTRDMVFSIGAAG